MKTYIGNTRYKILDANGQRMMMAANSKPYDAKIEYLESNMTDIQYIDLGLKGTQNVVVELKFSTTALSDVGQAIFGSRYSWGTGTQGSAFMLFIGSGDTKYTFQYGHDGDVHQVSSVQYNSQTWHTATLGKNARIDSWTFTHPYYTFTTPQNLTMFGSNFSGGAVNRGSNTRIAYCKVYVGGTLTLDLIPVRKNGIGYMYDKVSGQLFGNNGSGSFILGPDIIMTSKSNPEVLAICYAQGWCAHEDYMTASEADAVSNIGLAFRQSAIQHFDEFKYFTGLTSIPQYTFQECALTSIEIPNGVTSIGAHAFRKCESLVSVTIPASVTDIAQYAFHQCTALTTIKSLATSAPSIDYRAFYAVNTNGTLYVPQGSTGYDVWMSTGDHYLGKYNWTKVEF